MAGKHRPRPFVQDIIEEKLKKHVQDIRMKKQSSSEKQIIISLDKQSHIEDDKRDSKLT
jgi:hypothetical protein